MTLRTSPGNSHQALWYLLYLLTAPSVCFARFSSKNRSVCVCRNALKHVPRAVTSQRTENNHQEEAKIDVESQREGNIAPSRLKPSETLCRLCSRISCGVGGRFPVVAYESAEENSRPNASWRAYGPFSTMSSGSGGTVKPFKAAIAPSVFLIRRASGHWNFPPPLGSGKSTCFIRALKSRIFFWSAPFVLTSPRCRKADLRRSLTLVISSR